MRWPTAVLRTQRSDRRTTQPGDRRTKRRGGRREQDRSGRDPVLLVADSNRNSRVEFARYLDDCGFRVVDAADGDDALAKIRTTPPHVILMELGLPRMPAWRLASQLPHSTALRHTPIIVMSPAIITTSDFEGTSAGPILFRPAGMLVKPFPLATLREEIRRVIRVKNEASREALIASRVTG